VVAACNDGASALKAIRQFTPTVAEAIRQFTPTVAVLDGPGLAAVHTADRNLRQAACSVGLDPSYWYPVEFDSALRREQVTGVRFQDTSVALFRNRDGEVHAIGRDTGKSSKCKSLILLALPRGLEPRFSP
jgi:hypothetical protein